MGSVAETVREIVSRDGIVLEALRRGFVNHRALARWVIETHGLDASEEAALSGLRRRETGLGEPVIEAARRVLAQASLRVRSDVVLLVVPRDPRALGTLQGLSGTVDLSGTQPSRITRGQEAVKLVVDEDDLDAVLDQLGSVPVDDVVEDLTELQVRLPQEALDTPGVLMLLCSALALLKINLVDVTTGVDEHLLVVPEREATLAYQALRGEIDRARRTLS